MPFKPSWSGVMLTVPFVLLSASFALAAPFDAPMAWYASRPLSQQVDWSKPTMDTEEELLRQAYVMAELSQSVYSNANGSRAKGVQRLGFDELKFIKKSATVNGGSAGVHVGIAVGGAVDIALGTGGLGSVVGGVIGFGGTKFAQVDPEALVVESSDHSMRVAALRGSGPWQDWVLDFNAGTIRDDVDDVTYHHGFFLYAGLVYGEIKQQLGDACKPGGQKVWITGHSLGGAAAQLVAYWLDRDGCDIDGVMTFAAPSPGRQDFQEAYDRQLETITHRFMRDGDPVACLPMGLDWAQNGQLHAFTDRTFVMNASSARCIGDDGTVEGKVRAFVEALYEVADPSTTYVEWLESIAPKVGLCPKRRGAKIFVGIVSGGAAPAACKTIDVLSDMLVLKDQLLRLYNLVLNDSDPAHHKLDCGYIDRIVTTGSDLGVFLDPIWAQRMEEVWTSERFGVCNQLPGPTPGLNAEGCPGTQVCCTVPHPYESCVECGRSENACNF